MFQPKRVTNQVKATLFIGMALLLSTLFVPATNADSSAVKTAPSRVESKGPVKAPAVPASESSESDSDSGWMKEQRPTLVA